MDKNKSWIIKSEKEIFKAKIFDIYELDCFLPSKSVSNNFISLHMNNWVNTFALTSDNKVILVKQHRLGKDLVTLEVPAGAINPEEDPQLAALRELKEETGYTPGKIILMKSIFVNPAIQNNKCYFYLALNCIKTSELHLDPTEELDIILKDLDEVFDSIFNSNLIENSIALMSIMFAKEYLAENIFNNAKDQTK
jgi:ADP-ribose pyrophosphatase